MVDIFEIFGEYSYLGIFLVILGVNVSPILKPPSWIVLTSFYLLDPSLNVFLLAVVGATGATAEHPPMTTVPFGPMSSDVAMECHWDRLRGMVVLCVAVLDDAPWKWMR